MKFFIKRFSTLPNLEIDLEDISKKYNIKPDHWDSCAVTFSMYDKNNNIYKIANKEADLVTKERQFDLGDPYNYYLRYSFTQKDTSKFGDFIGEFKVDFLGTHPMGKITIPVDGSIDISIKDSITRTDLSIETPITANRVWYYGIYKVPGAFAEIPSAEDIDILSGINVTNQNPKLNLTITYNSDPDDFIWFAIPTIFGKKNKWDVTLFNSGNIGGSKISNGNLFPTPETILLNGVNYDIYISNYRTSVQDIIIRKL
jgi:hypothetical protein